MVTRAVVERKAGSLAGRHAARRTPGNVRYLAPLAAAALVSAVLAVVYVTAGGLPGISIGRDTNLADPSATGQVTPTLTAPDSSSAASGSASAAPTTPSPQAGSPSSPAVTRTPDRASRGEARSAKASATPSATPSRSSSSSPKVVSSGTCEASYYATGSTTANGEAFDPDGLTAAHKTLPFDTRVRVTNTANGKSVVVRINDRGPFVAGRCIDLARGAFSKIASLSSGVIDARYEVLDT